MYNALRRISGTQRLTFALLTRSLVSRACDRAQSRYLLDTARPPFARVRFGFLSGAFYTLVPIRPRRRGERRSLRTFAGVSLRPSLGFNPPPSTPFNSATDAFQLHPDVGAVVDVTLRIVPNAPVRKTSRTMSPDDLVRAIVAASNAMRRCERKHGDDAESAWACAMDDDAVRGLDETQFFWFFPLNKVVRVDFSHLDALPRGVTPSRLGRATGGRRRRNLLGGAMPGRGDFGWDSVTDERRTLPANLPADLRDVVKAQPPDAPRDVTERFRIMGDNGLAQFWARQWERSTSVNVESGVYDARDAYLTMSEEQYDAHDEFWYDQVRPSHTGPHTTAFAW